MWECLEGRDEERAEKGKGERGDSRGVMFVIWKAGEREKGSRAKGMGGGSGDEEKEGKGRDGWSVEKGRREEERSGGENDKEMDGRKKVKWKKGKRK